MRMLIGSVATAALVGTTTWLVGCGLIPLPHGPEKNGGNADGAENSGDKSGPPPLWSGTAVEVPPAYAPLAFGMSKDDAKKANERFVSSGSIDEDRYPGVSFFVSYEKKGLDLFWLSLDDNVAKTVVADISKAWGDPLEGKYLDYEYYGWFNDDTGTRLLYHDKSIKILPYVKFDDLFASDKEPFFVEMIGKTHGELEGMDIHPSAKWDEEHVDLWQTKYGAASSFTRIQLQFDKKGQLESYYYTVDFGEFMSTKDEVLKIIRDRYGDGKKTENGYQLTKKSPVIRVKYSDISHNWQVSVDYPY